MAEPLTVPDKAPRRLATMLADRTAHGGEQPQLGIDGTEVAHSG